MTIWVYSGNVYNASPPGTTTFPLVSEAGNAIEYLQRSHIHVYKSTDEGKNWLEIGSPASWSLNEEGTSVVLTAGIAADEWVLVQRLTPFLHEYVEFQASSQLTANQLNTAEKFSIYVDQELSDSSRYTDGQQITDDAPSDGSLYGRLDAAWSQVPPPGISDAPSDNKEYARLNGNWVEIPEDQTGVPEAPIDSKTYGRNNAAWVEVTGGGSGGGIVYKGTRDLTLAAPATSSDGDFYVNTATSGVVDNTWTGIGGDALTGAERVAYDGTIWEMLPMPPAPAGVVEEVISGNDVTVNSSDPAKPVVSVTPNAFIPYDVSSLASLP